MSPTTIKTIGYVISTLSVVLLGVVSWHTASKQPLLLVALIVGMVASVTGMVLRWLSYRIEERLEGKP